MHHSLCWRERAGDFGEVMVRQLYLHGGCGNRNEAGMKDDGG